MFLFLLIFVPLSFALSTPTLQDAKKYLKKDIRILDDLYSVGYWDLTFNESLYVYEPFGSIECFRNTSCRFNNIPCDPCDWTDPLICSGQIRGPNSTCPCGTPPLMCDRSMYIYDYMIWPKGDPWTTIEAKNGIADLVFHPPPPPNNCSCIIVKYDVLEGLTQGVLLYYGETWYYTNGEYVISQYGTATVCPSNRYWGQSMILRIIADSAKSGYLKFNVSITYKDITSTIHSPNCIVPTDLQSTHQCLPTGILNKLSPLPGLTYIRIVIDPPTDRCGVITVWASSVEHLMSKNPWVSPQNSTDAYRVGRTSSPDGRPWPSTYPFCLEPNERIYIFVLSAVPVDFLIDTSKEWLILRPLTELPPPDYYRRLFSAVTAICPGKNFTAYRSSYSVSENMDTGSGNLRVLYPSDDLDAFSPPPMFAADYYYKIRDIPFKPSISNRFVIALFLKQRLLTRIQPLSWTNPWLQNSYEWITENEWNNCTLMIGGKIAGKDGSAIFLHIKNTDIKGGLPKCDPILYANISAEIDKIKQFESDGSLISAYRSWFLQDRIISSNEFYSCKSMIESYYSRTMISQKTVVTNQCVANFGSIEFNNDECCLLNDVSLYDKCLIRKRNITNQFKINKYSEELDQCQTKQCMQTSLTDLLLQYNSGTDPTACTNSIERPADQNVYYHCIDKYWGKEPMTHAGINCTHDIDCPNSKCNIYSHRCFENVSTIEPLLISCIYDGITQYTKTFISNALGLNPTDSDIKNKWLLKFSSHLLCSDPYIPVGFNVQQVVYARCPGCTFPIPNSTLLTVWAVSPGSSWPSYGYSCWAPGSASCSRSIAPVTARTYCAIQGCNYIPYEEHGYFPYISPISDCVNKTFCGITDDNFFYNDITHIVPLNICDNSILCILANGTQIVVANISICNSIFSCDAICQNCNENKCLNSGKCSDATDYDIGIWREKYKNVQLDVFLMSDIVNRLIRQCQYANHLSEIQ